MAAEEIAVSVHDFHGVVNELAVTPAQPLPDEEMANLVRTRSMLMPTAVGLRHFNDPLNFRPPILGRAGHDPQVVRHLDLATVVSVAAEDEDLTFWV